MSLSRLQAIISYHGIASYTDCPERDCFFKDIYATITN